MVADKGMCAEHCNRCNREMLHSQKRCKSTNMQTQEAIAKEKVPQMPVTHIKQNNCKTTVVPRSLLKGTRAQEHNAWMKV